VTRGLAAAPCFAALCLAAPAAAQWSDALDPPLPRPAEEATPTPVDEDEDEDEVPFAGPRVQLGYAFYGLADGFGGGDVHAGHVAVFIGLPLPQLRFGVNLEFAGRDYSLGGGDLILRGEGEIGVQLPGLIDPVVPFVSGLGTGGVLLGERFETNISYALGGGGVRLGVEVALFRNLHLHASFAYLRVEMDGAAFDLFQLRLAVGL
jgi:hypothetical protein